MPPLTRPLRLPRLSTKASALLGLALLTGLLLPHPARAQGWVPCKADGTPLQQGNSGDGSATLIGSGATPSVNPTGVYTRLFDWWLDAYAPNTQSPAGGASPGFGGLSLNSFAANNSDATGFFDPNDWRNYRSMDATLPPDITGGVKTTENDTLTAYFVWTGPGPVPDHADFLIKTSVSATASVDYGQSPASSGLSATASATLGSDKADATASFPGDNQTQIKPGSHLVRVTPNGGVATVSLSGSAMMDASDSLPDGVWTSWFGSHMDYLTDPAGGHGNGPTRANAAASASGTAYHDNREMTISSGIETSYYKGGADPETMSYRQQNLRQSDGSIAVDCAVVPNTGILGGGGYHADVTLTANPVGFLNPSPSFYNWDIDGGSESEFQNHFGQTITPSYDFNAGASSAATLGASSKIKVSVADDDGAKAESNYTIRWHYPVENWAALDKATEIAPTIYGSTDGTQPAGGQVNVNVTGKGQVDISAGEKGVGGVLTTATAVFVGEVDPLLLGLAGAAGYTLSLSSPPDVTVYTLPGSLEQLQSDVGTELAIASGNTSSVFMPNTARMESALAANISASGDYAGYFRGNYGTMSFTGLVGQHRFTKPYTGDAYDGHGYSGPAVGTVKYPGEVEYVYTWTLAGGPSGHS